MWFPSDIQLSNVSIWCRVEAFHQNLNGLTVLMAHGERREPSYFDEHSGDDNGNSSGEPKFYEVSGLFWALVSDNLA